MPTPLEDAIAERDAARAERDAARNERDAAVAAGGKVAAALRGQIETEITERDAARNERDAAVTAKGKAVAKLQGQTDLAKQHKGERDAVKADLGKKIKDGEEADRVRKKLVDDAVELQGKAQTDAKAAKMAQDKAKAAQAVEAKKAADLAVSVEAHAKAIDGHVGAIGELEEKMRVVGIAAADDAKKIKELESTVAEQGQELLRLRPARPITP